MKYSKFTIIIMTAFLAVFLCAFSPVGSPVGKIAGSPVPSVAVVEEEEEEAADPTITGWSKIGNTFTTNITSDYGDICGLSATTIAMINSTDNNLKKLSWNGTDWSVVGNALSVTVTGSGGPGIGCMGANRVAIVNRDSATQINIKAYDFNGTDWAQVGNTLTKSSTVADFYPRAATAPGFGSYLFVATSTQMLAYTFNGTDFTQVGQITGLTDNDPGLAALSDSLVCRVFNSTDKIDCYNFNGSSFSAVGNQYSATAYAGAYGMAGLDSDELIYFSANNSTVQGLKWDGSNIATQGAELSTGCASSWPRALARMTRTLVAVQSFSSGICTIQATTTP